MTDLREPISSGGSPAAASGAAPSADALHNLYRMSRTAGLGSGDYVAINNLAIVALVLGLGSVLSLIYPTALVLAVAGLTLGILSLVQIRSSNGTETGRTFAIGAILFSLAFGGASVFRLYADYAGKRADESAIGQVVDQINGLMVQQKYSEAYQTYFSDAFKREFDEKTFVGRWQSYVPMMGEVEKFGWGQRADFGIPSQGGLKRGIANSAIKFKKYPEPARQGITFIFENGQWRVDRIAQMFENEKKADQNAPSVMPDPNIPLGPEIQPELKIGPPTR